MPRVYLRSGAFQRAFAAVLAIAERSSDDSFAALALPPLRPPFLPRATAAGFLAIVSLFRMRRDFIVMVGLWILIA